MAQAAVITIGDGQATPVMHNFQPVSDQNGVALFEDRASGIFIGFNTIGIAVVRPKRRGTSANGRYLIRVTLDTPILETISNNTSSGIAPAPTIAYSNRVRCEFDYAERSTKPQRKDTRTLFSNFLANSQFIAANDDLDQISI